MAGRDSFYHSQRIDHRIDRRRIEISQDIQSWQCIDLSCNVYQCVLHLLGRCHSDYALCRRALLSNRFLCHSFLPAPLLILDSSYSSTDLVSQFTWWILHISWHSYPTSVSILSVELVETRNLVPLSRQFSNHAWIRTTHSTPAVVTASNTATQHIITHYNTAIVACRILTRQCRPDSRLKMVISLELNTQTKSIAKCSSLRSGPNTKRL